MMKYLTFLIIFLVNNHVYCQIYKFDQLSTFELVGKNKVISKIQKLTNSGDVYYSMDFKSDNNVELIDHKTFHRHFFNVVKRADNKLIFNYERSCDEREIHEDIKNSGRDYRIGKAANDQYILGKYDSSTSKYPYFEVRFQMEETNSNHLALLHTIDFELLEKFVENIKKDKSYSVNKLEYYVKGKKGKEQMLKSLTAVDVEVKLPEKLYLKCLKVF